MRTTPISNASCDCRLAGEVAVLYALDELQLATPLRDQIHEHAMESLAAARYLLDQARQTDDLRARLVETRQELIRTRDHLERALTLGPS